MLLQDRIQVLTEETGSVSQVYVFGGGIFSPRKHTVVIILLTSLSAHSLNMRLYRSIVSPVMSSQTLLLVSLLPGP